MSQNFITSKIDFFLLQTTGISINLSRQHSSYIQQDAWITPGHFPPPFVENALLEKNNLLYVIVVTFSPIWKFSFFLKTIVNFAWQKSVFRKYNPFKWVLEHFLKNFWKFRIYNSFLVHLFSRHFSPVNALVPSLPLRWQTARYTSRILACNWQISCKKTWMLDEWFEGTVWRKFSTRNMGKK